MLAKLHGHDHAWLKPSYEGPSLRPPPDALAGKTGREDKNIDAPKNSD